MSACFPDSGGNALNAFPEQLLAGLARLTEPGQGILLAVSGGRDSMALLHAAARLRHSGKCAALAMAHLNHGLRDEAGERAAELVRSAAACFGLPVVVSRCEPGELQAASKGSLEEAARKVRYEFLRRTAIELQLPFVVTAHHAGDQAETVLHNILRGTGLPGLRGIPELRLLGDTIKLIRPMLTISPDAIVQFVAEQRISFADDATNADSGFTRNRIRNQLLPSLRTDFNPRVDAALNRLSLQTREIIECLDAMANQILNHVVLEQTPAVCRLDGELLRSWPEPLVRHALTVLWTRCEWPRQKMTSEHWTRLAGVAVQPVEQCLDLPGRMRVSCAGRIVRIEALSLQDGI